MTASKSRRWFVVVFVLVDVSLLGKGVHRLTIR
jgi:hypothetical protein